MQTLRPASTGTLIAASQGYEMVTATNLTEMRDEFRSPLNQRSPVMVAVPV